MYKMYDIVIIMALLFNVSSIGGSAESFVPSRASSPLQGEGEEEHLTRYHQSSSSSSSVALNMNQCQNPSLLLSFYSPTQAERLAVSEFRRMTRSVAASPSLSPRAARWLQSEVSDVELLCFLRARGMHLPLALDMISQHANWRETFLLLPLDDGHDGHDGHDDGGSKKRDRTYVSSSGEEEEEEAAVAMRRHVYWTGLSHDHCAVLVVEAAIFDLATRDTHTFLR